MDTPRYLLEVALDTRMACTLGVTSLPLVFSGLAIITLSIKSSHIQTVASEAEGLQETLYWLQLKLILLVTVFFLISFFFFFFSVFAVTGSGMVLKIFLSTI